MLRIHRNDIGDHRVILTLEGHVVLEWADGLRRAGFSVALEFSRVAFIGRTGLEALTRLSQAGVEIFACPPLIAEVLEHQGISVRSEFGERGET